MMTWRRVLLILMLTAAVQPALAADRTIASIDLAQAFETHAPWRFTAMQGPDAIDPIDDTDKVPGAITLCISADDGRICRPELDRMLMVSGKADLFDVPHTLIQARIVQPNDTTRLLLLQVASVHSGDGDQRRATILLAYDRATDQFTPIYEKHVDTNNDQEIRFIDSGPLRGAVISAEPTGDAPFGFWITVNRLIDDRYTPVLRFRSATRYGDGNTLPVIDSEMPNIEHRLGLWHDGMALPLPAGSCPAPHLSGGALWCQL